MSIEVKGKIIETDEEGYLVNPEDWNEDVAEVLIKQHQEAGHKEVTEAGWQLINYFRDYYEDHMIHPSMRRLLNERAKLDGKHYEDEKDYRDYLYELFPHEPIRMLCKLAGLPNPKHEVET